VKLSCTSLVLTPTLQDGTLVLLRAIDAILVGREEQGVPVPRDLARNHLGILRRQDPATLRSFVARARLSPVPLSSLDDARVATLVCAAIKSGELVLLRQGELPNTTTPDGAAEQRRLVKDLAAKTGQPFLVIAGRRYRLVADVDLERTPDRDSYQVVRRQDAAQLLEDLARQPTTPAASAKLLLRATELLSNDWRLPADPKGLVLLLRAPITGSASRPDEPAMTPSQLKRLLSKTEWIEIVLSDDLGKPYTGPYEIELPNGSKVTGNFDGQGMWADYDIDPGSCKLIIPDVPERAKPGMAKAWISLKLVDEDGEPMEGYAYTLALPDGSERKGTTDEAIRIDDIDPGGTCVLSVEEEA